MVDSAPGADNEPASRNGLESTAVHLWSSASTRAWDPEPSAESCRQRCSSDGDRGHESPSGLPPDEADVMLPPVVGLCTAVSAGIISGPSFANIKDETQAKRKIETQLDYK